MNIPLLVRANGGAYVGSPPRAHSVRDSAMDSPSLPDSPLPPDRRRFLTRLSVVLSGAIAVEAIFSWPGLGYETYEAINGPDLPMLQGLFLVFSASVIVFNLVADLLYAWLDPRVREA